MKSFDFRFFLTHPGDFLTLTLSVSYDQRYDRDLASLINRDIKITGILDRRYLRDFVIS